MSFDIEIWSVQPVDDSALIPSTDWQKTELGWTYESDDWQIVVSRSDRVWPEDIPKNVTAALPGIEYLTQVVMEGRVPKSASSRLNTLAKRMAKLSHGVIHNPQEDTVATPAGVCRLPKFEKSKVFSILEMSWWFLGGPLVHADGFDQLIRLFEQMLPEALPRRYGDYEPPQHVYAVTGRAHFLTNFPPGVWYPSPPVVGVHLGLPQPAGPSPRGFRANHLSIAFDSIAPQQPGWQSQVHRVWLGLSQLVRPFFGNVRILNGYHRARGTYAYGRETEAHPVESWWWRGVPRDLGNAIVLGEEYQRLLPAFAAKAKLIDQLAFLTLPEWSVKANLGEQFGGVPDEIAQPMKPPAAAITTRPELFAFLQKPLSYPPIWPFDGPFEET